MTPDARSRWPLPPRYDFFGTIGLLNTGNYDPTLHRETDGLWRTAHTRDGPATVRLTVGAESLDARAWGPGAALVLADVPRWVGLDEPPWQLPSYPVVDQLMRTHGGLRLTDTRDVFDALLPIVLQQLVTWQEAARMWRRLCMSVGTPAPGPAKLWLSPTPRAIRAAGSITLQAAGIGMRQVRTLVDVARVAHALQRAADVPTADAATLLQKINGVGPWTAQMVLGVRLGRPEAIPVGDFHLPNTVAWALAGEPRGTDERMLELLAPFEGQAFRVIRLLLAAGIEAPKRGPRITLRKNQRR
jgi:3-methyladenine DNA glycosylase/8-oxoguanine DNA glycosylase